MLIVESVESEIEKSDLGVQQDFTIKATAKAFAILSSGLYSDKISAIIRELSTNAADSHIESGVGTPFEIHLPNSIDPHFWVEDFGTGMSHEDVLHLYTTYFDSTRTKSNDFTGALGLGSKSPFSYVDCFNVVSTQDGVSRTYSAYLNEHGCPSITLMFEELCPNKSNGVRVSFSVKHEDFYNFQVKCAKVLEFFTNYKVINCSSFSPYKPNISMKGSNWSLRHEKYSGPRAIQGPIAYPLNIVNCEDPIYMVLSKFPLDIFVNIGDLEIAASREDLSYTKPTVRKLLDILAGIKQEILDLATKEVQSGTTGWDQCFKFHSLRMKNDLFRVALDNWGSDIVQIKSKLIDNWLKVNFNKFNRIKTVFYANSATSGKSCPGFLHLKAEPLIVYNDLKKGALDIFKAHRYSLLHKTFLYISPSGLWSYDATTKTRTIHGTEKDSWDQFQELLKDMGDPPYTLLSSLVNTVSVKETLRRKIFCYKMHGDRWEEIEINTDEPRYYVDLSYLKPIMDGEEISSLFRIVQSVKTLQILPWDVNIYGFSISNKKKSIEKNPNWIPLIPFLKAKIQEAIEADNQDITDFMDRKSWPHWVPGLSKYQVLERLLPCALKDFLDNARRVDKIYHSISEKCYNLIYLASMFKCPLPKSNFRGFSQDYIEDYPLISLDISNFTSFPVEFVEYVNLIEYAKKNGLDYKLNLSQPKGEL